MSQQRGPSEPQEVTRKSNDPHFLQARWLAAHKGKRIKVWLVGDTGVSPLPAPYGLEQSGILVGADQFTIAIKGNDGEIALIYKSAIAMMKGDPRTRAEGEAPQ